MKCRLISSRISRGYRRICLGVFLVLNPIHLVGENTVATPTLLPPPAHTYTKQLTKKEIEEFEEANPIMPHAEKQRWIMTQLRERGEYSVPSPEYERALLILKGHFSIEGHSHSDYILLYDSDTIPVLNKMLRDGRCEIHWKNALNAMGIIVSVDPSALSVKQALDNVKYAETKYEEEQNANRLFALQNAYTALALTGTPEALNHLKKTASYSGENHLNIMTRSFAIEALSKFPGNKGVWCLEELLMTSEDSVKKHLAEDALLSRKVNLRLAERRNRAWRIRIGEIPHPSFNNNQSKI